MSHVLFAPALPSGRVLGARTWGLKRQPGDHKVATLAALGLVAALLVMTAAPGTCRDHGRLAQGDLMPPALSILS